MPRARYIIRYALIPSLLYLVMKQWGQREVWGVFRMQERVAKDNAVVGTGEYRSEQMVKLREYLEQVEATEGKFTGFGDGRVGVWKPSKKNPYGLEFGMMVAINYLRCCPDSTKLLSTPEELDGIDYLISPWEAYSLEKYGFKEVASENFVYVYQR